ncbi:MAG: peptidase C39 [Eubacteriales bacterium]|nr:peptidase C39 [Eubacteriales bacterium]
MKNPLHYQQTEYDCGPTTMMNAISYLFDREEIPPEIIRNIMLYCLDCYGEEGEPGKSGTSRMAMLFLSNWLNQFGKVDHLSIRSKYLSGECVFLGDESYINDALMRGGAVVLRLIYEVEHYVLLTKVKDGLVYLFDPYYEEDPYEEEDILMDWDHPFAFNRVVPEKYFNCEGTTTYALGPKEDREAVLLFHKEETLTAEQTIEYFI